MSPADSNNWQITGVYLRCANCQAPMSDPMPPRWALTVAGQPTNTTITPHLPDCHTLSDNAVEMAKTRLNRALLTQSILRLEILSVSRSDTPC